MPPPPNRAAFAVFVILPPPSRHLSRPWLRDAAQKNTLGCFVAASFNRLEREREGERKREGDKKERERGRNRCCASLHSFYLTSLWCETAQYSAFPDHWRLNTLSWGLCSGMAEMQIFHAPPKSNHFGTCWTQKREYISPGFQPEHGEPPAARSHTQPNTPESRWRIEDRGYFTLPSADPRIILCWAAGQQVQKHNVLRYLCLI